LLSLVRGKKKERPQKSDGRGLAWLEGHRSWKETSEGADAVNKLNNAAFTEKTEVYT
jgi:hypothetical protein